MKDFNSPFYNLARDFVTGTNQTIFITGKAGTGKTTFLRQLKAITGKQMAIVAPTGIAAINAGGTTMHSFFQLPFTPFTPNQEGKKHLIEKSRIRANRRKVLQELELLVIDEISMVRADTLDAVDTILRSIRYRHSQPFGGVQVIFFGDLFQLSPVVTEDDKAVLNSFYPSPYFFHSQVMMQNAPLYIEFDKIFRQSNADFIRILNEVRNNCLSNDGLQMLMSRYQPDFKPDDNDGYITLTTHNYKADKMNADEMEKLPGKAVCYSATIEGDFGEKSYPTDKDLMLKTGAKVMIIKNDIETPRRFYNGKTGIIKHLNDDEITIHCPEDNAEIKLTRMEWENISYSSDPKTLNIHEDVIGKFIQFPLRLAWAITIHKSQGLTFSKAVIDAGDAFAAGQVYVALSRCTTLEGIVLKSRINPYSLQNDNRIVDFESHKAPAETLEKILSDTSSQYREQLLHKLYGFEDEIRFCRKLIQLAEKESGSFNKETLGYLNNLLLELRSNDETGNQFKDQLNQIFRANPINEDYLAGRLDASFQYFAAKNNSILKILNASPASTDSKENAKEYNENIKNIFEALTLKNHLIKNLKHPFQPSQYFEIRNKFVLPDFNVNAYSKTSAGKNIQIKNPILYNKLLALRNKICEPGDIPLYVVAANKTLQEMAEYLPTTEKELLLIHGLGKTKVSKYGKQFLEVIIDYCLEHNLTSIIYEKSIEDNGGRKKKK